MCVLFIKLFYFVLVPPVTLAINCLCPSDAAGASAGQADGDPAGRCRAGETPGSGLEDPPRRLKVPQRHPEHKRSRRRRQQRQPRWDKFRQIKE